MNPRRRYASFTDAELKNLSTERKAYKTAIEEKRIPPKWGQTPQKEELNDIDSFRYLCVLAELENGLIVSDEVKSFIADIARDGILIQNQKFSSWNDEKKHTCEGEQEKEAAVREFFNQQINANKSEEKLFDLLINNHTQAVFPGKYSNAIKFAIKRDQSDVDSENSFDRNCSAKPQNLCYFVDDSDEKRIIRVKGEASFTVFTTGAVEMKCSLPGKIYYDSSLAPHGFMLEKGFPCFSSTVLKKLCLAIPQSIDRQLLPNISALATAEEKLRDIYQDGRLIDGIDGIDAPHLGMREAKKELDLLETQFNQNVASQEIKIEEANQWIQQRIHALNHVRTMLIKSQFDRAMTDFEDFINNEQLKLESKHIPLQQNKVNELRAILNETKNLAELGMAPLESLTQTLDKTRVYRQTPNPKLKVEIGKLTREHEEAGRHRLAGLLVGFLGIVIYLLNDKMYKWGVALFKGRAYLSEYVKQANHEEKENDEKATPPSSRNY